MPKDSIPQTKKSNISELPSHVQKERLSILRYCHVDSKWKLDINGTVKTRTTQIAQTMVIHRVDSLDHSDSLDSISSVLSKSRTKLHDR